MKVVILVALLCCSLASCAIRVVDKSPPDGKIVLRGRSVRLSCRADARWFLCVWRTPSNEKSCAIQHGDRSETVCNQDPRIRMDPGLTNCDIVLNDVRPEDFGSWMCLVTDSGELETDRALVALEVGQQAKVSFQPSFGMNNELRITEGQTASIHCAASGGYPAAVISWEVPSSRDDKDTYFDTSAELVVNHDSSAHTSDVFHTVKYKANLTHDGREVTCVARQLSRDGRTILYEASASIRLRVDKIVQPAGNAFTQKIGIISGVLLIFILLILLLVFCLCVVCKRRRRKGSRPSSSQGIADGAASTSAGSTPEQPIKPIWTTGPEPRVGPAAGDPRALQDLLEIRRAGEHQTDGFSGHRPPTSQGTSSTRSTTSQNSWEEENRSNGEVEEVPVETRVQMSGPPSSSLLETRFPVDDYARTVLLHPDPRLNQTHPPSVHYTQVMHPPPSSLSRRPYQQAPLLPGRRPSSSADTAYPPPQYYSQIVGPARPTSAMSHPEGAGSTPGFYPGRGVLPPANGPTTTSAKSVFDCELGCFDLNGEPKADCPHSHSSSSATSSHRASVDAGPPNVRQSHQQRTSDMRDV